MKKIRFTYTTIFALIISNVCIANPNLIDLSHNQTELDLQLSKIITKNQLTGAPVSNLSSVNIHSPKAQLGMKLFFTKSLGGDGSTACATCHHPLLGGGDNLSLSIGVNAQNPDILGINRKHVSDLPPQVPRNAPTTFNVSFWKKSMFHDMRIIRLADNSIHTPDVAYPQTDALAGENLVQAQARFPITAKHEMRADYKHNSYNQTLRRALAKRLSNKWLSEFRKGFSEPNGTVEDLITEQNFSEAIADYERSQVFINNPWNDYIKGNKSAISEQAKKGARLFYASQENGGANCVQCHQGDFFTDEIAHNTAMPQIGPGKNNGKTKTNDFGFNLTTKKESDKFKFRTPTLLNVEVTGPWGHDGAFTSLEAITQHMLTPIKSALNYNPTQLQQKTIDVKDTKANTLEAIKAGVDIVENPQLVDKENINALVSFMKTLTDPCVTDKNCLSKWIPNNDHIDPDNNQLQALKNDKERLF